LVPVPHWYKVPQDKSFASRSIAPNEKCLSSTNLLLARVCCDKTKITKPDIFYVLVNSNTETTGNDQHLQWICLLPLLTTSTTATATNPFWQPSAVRRRWELTYTQWRCVTLHKQHNLQPTNFTRQQSQLLVTEKNRSTDIEAIYVPVSLISTGLISDNIHKNQSSVGPMVDSSWVAFKHSWPWPWPWIGSYGIPSCITHRSLSTHQILLKSEKLFSGWT